MTNRVQIDYINPWIAKHRTIVVHVTTTPDTPGAAFDFNPAPMNAAPLSQTIPAAIPVKAPG